MSFAAPASESLICLRSGRPPAASVFQVSVLSAFPAPGVGCISGFRPCLFLRFPTLPAPPVSGVGCFSGFHLVRLCGFQPTCSSGSRCCPLLRFSLCPSQTVFRHDNSTGSRRWLLLRFSVWLVLPVFSLAFSSGSRICPALRLDALLCQLFVSPLPPPFVTQPAARRLSPENLPSPTAPGCASSPLRDVSRRPRTGSGSRGCCRRCRGRHGLSARMSSAAARGSR